MRIFAITCCLALALSACKPATAVPPAPTDASNQAQTEGSTVFPDAMPSYIPRYAGAKKIEGAGLGLANSMIKNMAGGGAAIFSTTDTPEKVISFYKVELTKSGLEEQEANAKTPNQSIAFVKKGDNGGMVIVTAQLAPNLGTLAQVIFMPLPDQPKN